MFILNKFEGYRWAGYAGWRNTGTFDDIIFKVDVQYTFVINQQAQEVEYIFTVEFTGVSRDRGSQVTVAYDGYIAGFYGFIVFG